MRKILLLIAITLMGSTFAHAQQKTVRDLYGKWVAVGSTTEEFMTLLIQENGKVVFNDSGEKNQATFKTNFEKSPIWFDISVSLPGGQKSVLLGILRFLDDNTIEWEFDEKRLTKFSDKFGYSAIFKREK